jgi:hypothetical protein
VRNGHPHIIIGATGGSGTRLLVRLAEHAGYAMGAQLNHAGDSLPGSVFVRRWIPQLLAGNDSLSATERPMMRRDLARALEEHRGGSALSSEERWGIKNPQWIYLLPLVDTELPQSTFVHLVRDGRDMAFSDNQKQLALYGDHFVGGELRDLPTPVRSAMLWSAINLRALRYGRRHMADRYHLFRFEDFCNDPKGTVARYYDALGARVDITDETLRLIAQPSSLGRWQQQPRDLVEPVETAVRDSLAALGYLDTPASSPRATAHLAKT